MTGANRKGTRKCYSGERYRSGGEFSFSESSTTATKMPITSPPTKNINRFQPTEVGGGRNSCIMETLKRLRGETATMTSANSRETKKCNPSDWYSSGGIFSFTESFTAATKTPITSPPTKDINRFQPTEVGEGRNIYTMDSAFPSTVKQVGRSIFENQFLGLIDYGVKKCQGYLIVYWNIREKNDSEVVERVWQ